MEKRRREEECHQAGTSIHTYTYILCCAYALCDKHIKFYDIEPFTFYAFEFDFRLHVKCDRLRFDVRFVLKMSATHYDGARNIFHIVHLEATESGKDRENEKLWAAAAAAAAAQRSGYKKIIFYEVSDIVLICIVKVNRFHCAKCARVWMCEQGQKSVIVKHDIHPSCDGWMKRKMREQQRKIATSWWKKITHNNTGTTYKMLQKWHIMNNLCFIVYVALRKMPNMHTDSQRIIALWNYCLICINLLATQTKTACSLYLICFLSFFFHQSEMVRAFKYAFNR